MTLHVERDKNAKALGQARTFEFHLASSKLRVGQDGRAVKDDLRIVRQRKVKRTPL